MIRSRSRVRGGVSLPWFSQGKADGIDPTFWADFANNRYAVRPVPIRVASVCNGVMLASINVAGMDSAVHRYKEVIADDYSELIFSFTNKFLDKTTGDTNNGNSFTIVDAALQNEAGTISVPVYFGGSRSKVINDGDIDIKTDPIYALSFGLPYYARNSVFYLKFKVLLPSAGANLPWGENYTPYGTIHKVDWFNSATTTPSSTDAIGNYTVSSGLAFTAGTNSVKPMCLGRPLNDNGSYITIGDSISEGLNDTDTNAVGKGFFKRATRSASNDDYLPSLNFGVHGIVCSTQNGSTYTRTYMKYAKYAVLELGTNGIDTIPLATHQTNFSGLINNLRAVSVKKIIVQKLLARTTSTDSWATEVNQTPYSAAWDTGGMYEQINAWYDTLLAGGTIDYINDRSSVVSNSDTRFWKAGYTNDGIHPINIGHEAMAVTLRPIFRAIKKSEPIQSMPASSIFSYVRASGLSYFDASGNMQIASTDVVPIDYDPVTLLAKGLPSFEQRTNYIPNSTMVGTVDGVIGSGGSLPTGWGSSLVSGVSLSVQKVTIRNMSFLRCRFSGTPSASGNCSVNMVNTSTIAVVNGNVVGSSLYAMLNSGSFTNIGSPVFGTNIYNSTPAYLTTINTISISSLTSTLTRLGAGATVASATAAYGQLLLQFSVTNGNAIDITLDIAAPQLELGGYPTPFIPTTSASASRAFQTVTNSNSNTFRLDHWLKPEYGSVLLTYMQEYVSTGSQRAGEIYGDANNSIYFVRSSSAVASWHRNGGTTDFNPSATKAFTASEKINHGTAYNTNDFNVVVNGGTIVQDVTSVVPSNLSELDVGHQRGPTGYINGWIKELRYYPERISNSELQRITT